MDSVECLEVLFFLKADMLAGEFNERVQRKVREFVSNSDSPDQVDSIPLCHSRHTMQPIEGVLMSRAKVDACCSTLTALLNTAAGKLLNITAVQIGYYTN